MSGIRKPLPRSIGKQAVQSILDLDLSVTVLNQFLTNSNPKRFKQLPVERGSCSIKTSLHPCLEVCFDCGVIQVAPSTLYRRSLQLQVS
jgi:hypothetical protein